MFAHYHYLGLMYVNRYTKVLSNLVNSVQQCLKILKCCRLIINIPNIVYYFTTYMKSNWKVLVGPLWKYFLNICCKLLVREPNEHLIWLILRISIGLLSYYFIEGLLKIYEGYISIYQFPKFFIFLLLLRLYLNLHSLSYSSLHIVFELYKS